MKRKYTCACGHSLAFHNPDDNRCHQRKRVPQSHWDEKDYDGVHPFNRTILYEEVACLCQQYVGKRPKDTSVKPLV